ncbi:MAG: patatin-like phospholipase family protein [Gammaproteobacteria bacterium]|nr:patatin-like phospholipase family protein [Gammaproteobacteria bacterium]MBU1654047.1 patatin-like phospholipase family protein [Gammaproteobacteria bacterium]MBU1961743.1 patatin-like phospholipase family protein [Gammaproteobacteria bacterium]
MDILEKLRNKPPCENTNEDKSVYERAREANLTGLAFSGGGIRSAIFNLGVIQALAHYGLLSRFDYLSMVSGGGYIGGWLSTLLHRQTSKEEEQVSEASVRDFQSSLKSHPDNPDLPFTNRFQPVEHSAIRYLRRYCNYLSPRLGLSGDMLSTISISLRNSFLIQLFLALRVVAILLLAHLIALGSGKIIANTFFLDTDWRIFGGVLAISLMFIAAWSTGRLMSVQGIDPARSENASLAVFSRVLLPSLIAGWLFSVLLTQASDVNGLALKHWLLGGFLGYGASWLLGYLPSRFGTNRKPDASDRTPTSLSQCIRLFLAAACSGALLGLLMETAAGYFSAQFGDMSINIRHAAAYGPPLFFLGLTVIVSLHIGIAGNALSENDREWLARLGGFVLISSLAWAFVFSLVLYATPFVHWLADKDWAALVAWAGGSGVGVWFARSPTTNGLSSGNRWRELAATTGPWLFLSGVAVILGHLLHVGLLYFSVGDGFVVFPDSGFGFASRLALCQMEMFSLTTTGYAFLGALALMIGSALIFDINLFSLHALYSNRLTRTFLGASRSRHRHPNTFTGFDPSDDLPFSALRFQRPIPIINTAINMTGGDDLAWQTRRSASFTFTPSWTGFECLTSQGKPLGRYRHTEHYAGGISLGTLMATSGAAASPNMGYHTSAGVAALLTAFNLRLGRWCGNPMKDQAWKLRSPGIAATPILKELTGTANAQAHWVNLTDGGHFENLGVYELIRRRCRLIVVTDVGCDPNYEFEDLANLLRKCWVDFGINIWFDPTDFELMHPQGDNRYTGVHFAVARIRYRNRLTDEDDGALIYLKSSITGDEWPDLRQYADSHKDFPHETTSDQFFDENQFEAYRHLGYKIVAKMVAGVTPCFQPVFPWKPGEKLAEIPIAEVVKTLLSRQKHTKGPGS